MGTFIQIRIEHSKLAEDKAKELPPLCPVDIFVMANGQVDVRPEQEDECTLCELCLDAAPPGAIIIQKLYKDERLVSRGE